MDEKSNVIDIKKRLKEMTETAETVPKADLKPKIGAPKSTNPIMRKLSKFMNSNIKAKFRLEDLFR